MISHRSKVEFVFLFGNQQIIFTCRQPIKNDNFHKFYSRFLFIWTLSTKSELSRKSKLLFVLLYKPAVRMIIPVQIILPWYLYDFIKCLVAALYWYEPLNFRACYYNLHHCFDSLLCVLVAAYIVYSAIVWLLLLCCCLCEI